MTHELVPPLAIDESNPVGAAKYWHEVAHMACEELDAAMREQDLLDKELRSRIHELDHVYANLSRVLGELSAARQDIGLLERELRSCREGR